MGALRSITRRLGALKLSTQLLLTFLCSSLLILGAGSAYLYASLLEMLQHRSEEATVGSFRQVERSLLDFRSKTDSISKLIFLNPDFDTFLANSEPDAYERLQVIRSVQRTMSDQVDNNDFLQSIFVIAGDGRMIGVTDTTSYVDAKPAERSVLQGPIRKRAVEAYPGMAWTGDVLSTDFVTDSLFRNRAERAVTILSASRAVKAFYQSSPGGTLFLNVPESAVYDSFRDLTTLPDSRVFLLDQDGIVVSSSDKAGIGSRRPEIAGLAERYGSIAMEDGGRRQQLIYYRLGDTGWVLGMEIPLAAFMADIHSLRSIILVMLVVSLAIGGLFSYWWTRKLTGPIYALVAGMRNLKQGNLGTTIASRPRNELGVVMEEFNRMSSSIHDLVEDNRIIERKKKSAELKALQSQINPHFLFNTLNTIKWMAVSIRASAITETITSLGNLIQPIYKSGNPLIPLREELAYVRDYLIIMNRRFGEGIRVVECVDSAHLERSVPRLILQPVIENALLHGFEASRYRGEIVIGSSESGPDIRLHVADNGSGIAPDKLEAIRRRLAAPPFGDDAERASGNVGLANVHQRLQLHYGSGYGVEIESDAAGTRVTLSLPAVRKT